MRGNGNGRQEMSDNKGAEFAKIPLAAVFDPRRDRASHKGKASDRWMAVPERGLQMGHEGAAGGVERRQIRA